MLCCLCNNQTPKSASLAVKNDKSTNKMTDCRHWFWLLQIQGFSMPIPICVTVVEEKPEKTGMWVNRISFILSREITYKVWILSHVHKPYSEAGCSPRRDSKRRDEREEIKEQKWWDDRDKKNKTNRLGTGLRSAERMIKNREILWKWSKLLYDIQWSMIQFWRSEWG